MSRGCWWSDHGILIKAGVQSTPEAVGRVPVLRHCFLILEEAEFVRPLEMCFVLKSYAATSTHMTGQFRGAQTNFDPVWELFAGQADGEEQHLRMQGLIGSGRAVLANPEIGGIPPKATPKAPEGETGP
ncbi:hypothetical protein AK812_SmicGene11318 [Symbiodinium microadriaticum]|uniref:Uncharacterized protein n=1 Tax=Symbiodinium microadriaticum TaxID=2951 RepID=A0A1Q9EDL1_SYMMI|nr:hypothetical protein AK812_SmicGene11318 [Symbiodinium microadriaticum]